MSRILAPQTGARLMVSEHFKCGQLVVMLRGELDRGSVPDLCTYLEPFDPMPDLHLDLSQLDFVDVGGAMLLLEVSRRFEQHGGRLYLHDPGSVAARLFEILGVTAFAEIRSDALRRRDDQELPCR